MESVIYYGSLVLMIIGGASVAAAGNEKLKELVESTSNTWDNKIFKAISWFASKVAPFLNSLALNPKKPS